MSGSVGVEDGSCGCFGLERGWLEEGDFDEKNEEKVKEDVNLVIGYWWFVWD